MDRNRSSVKCVNSGHVLSYMAPQTGQQFTTFCVCNRLLTLKPGSNIIPSHKRPF